MHHRPLSKTVLCLFALALVVTSRSAQAASTCYSNTCGSCSPPMGESFAISTLVPAALFPATADHPLEFVDPGDERGRRLIATQEGAILVYDAVGGTLLPTPFLDLRSDGGGPGLDRVLYDGNERGLLALAVDPDYASTGRFYVYYTRDGTATEDGDIVVERYVRSAGNPDVADTAGTQILVIDHSASNHNGGDLVFGLDGMLYVSTGDGGGSCDSTGPNAQRPDRLLGKILRIDVHDVDPGATAPDACGLTPRNYEIPTGNPYKGVVDTPDPCDAVWALGMRNPFRMTLDRSTGDLFIGDVGQDSWEEFDYFPMTIAQTAPARNFGWKCREACENTTCSTTNCPTLPDGVTTCEYPYTAGGTVEFFDPITCHSNPNGWSSAMGGYLYRGSRVASLDGRYVYSDTGCGQIWVTSVFSPAAPVATTATCWEDTGFGIYGFAEDRLGEVYLVRGGNGRVDCIHDGNPDGCYWAKWRGLFEDDFESQGTTHWSSTSTP